MRRKIFDGSILGQKMMIYFNPKKIGAILLSILTGITPAPYSMGRIWRQRTLNVVVMTAFTGVLCHVFLFGIPVPIKNIFSFFVAANLLLFVVVDLPIWYFYYHRGRSDRQM